MSPRNLLISIIGAVVLLVVAVMLFSPGDNESRGEAKQLKERLEEAKKDNASLSEEAASLREENRRLQAQLAVATEGGGLDIEERQRLLDDRRASLDALQSQLAEREVAVEQREERADRQAREFHERTNMTMEEIGRAKQVMEDYDRMRAERDAAVAKVEGWLKFIWGVSIALALAVMACAILLYRSLSMHAQHRRETEYRRDVARLLGESISSHMPHEHAQTVVDAFDRLASVDGKQRSLPAPPRR